MDISITETLNCNVIEARCCNSFSAVLLYDIIRKLPDGNEVEFISNDGKMFSIRSGKSKIFFKLPSQRKIFLLLK